MILKRQGYYKEMPHGDNADPSILDFIHKNKVYKDEICRYLRNGFVLAACGSVVKDIIHPEKGIVGSPDDLTDGTWIWPADLAYYVENYDLKLDDAFIKHMIENSWSVSDDISIDEDNLQVI